LSPTFKSPPGTPPPKHPEATSENDKSGVSSFNDGNAPREVLDPMRFGDAAQRLDYQFSWSGSLYAPTYTDRDVVIYQSSPGRDMSDHYGTHTRLATITQVLPPANVTPHTVRLRFSRYWCIQTTTGPGEDEARFTLRAIAADGTEQVLRSPRLIDIKPGDSETLDIGPIVISDPGEFLIMVLAGEELDDLGANDNLGSVRVWLERTELVALTNQPSRRVLPRLTGSGGEYAVEILIEVE